MKIPATKPVHFSFTLHYGKINIGAIHRKSAWRVPEPQNRKKPDSSALCVAEPIAYSFIPPLPAIHNDQRGLNILGSNTCWAHTLNLITLR